MKTNRNTAVSLVIAIVICLTFQLSLAVSAQGGMFTPESGRVRDGALGDRPGVIGDETPDFNKDGMNGRSREMTPTPEDTAQKRVLGDTDTMTDTTGGDVAFWAISAVLVAAGAAVLIAALALPSKRRDRS